MITVNRQQLYDLYVKQGKSQREIAKILKCSQFKVRCLLREAGIKARSYKENKMPVPKGSHLAPEHRRSISLALGGSGVLKPEKRYCKYCGREIPFHKNNAKYCSRECCRKDKIGKQRPNTWKRIRKICPVCGKEFVTGGKAGHKEKIYCSMKCSSIAQRKPIENTVYKRRSAYWRELRLKIIDRDDYRCQFCGAQKTAKQLQVHHIIPTNVEQNFEEDNLITCCRGCHAIINKATQWGYKNNPEFDPYTLVSTLRVK